MKPRLLTYSLAFLVVWVVLLIAGQPATAQLSEEDTLIFLPLVQSSTHINIAESITVEGIVTRISAEHPVGRPIISHATLSITRVITGEYSSKQVVVRYLGGVIGDVGLYVSHQPVLAEGMEIIATLHPLETGEYAIHDADHDLNILNPELLPAFVLNGRRWQNANIPTTFQINPNTADVPGITEGDAIRRAMNTWSFFTGSFFEFAPAGNTACNANGSGTDGINCIVWTTATSDTGNALATAFQWVNSGTNQFSEVDIIFWGQTTTNNFFWSLNPASNNEFDVESVALHELGHAFGLGHEGCCDAIMNPTFGPLSQKRTLRQDDMDGINAIYMPALTTSFVDGAALATNFDCTTANRCRTVLRGVKHVANNGIVRISAGSYPETMVISRTITLESTGGVVTIGQ